MPQEVRDTHRWVGATTIAIDSRQAGPAHRRGTLRLTAQEVTVLDVYCSECRRPYSAVRDKPCEVGLWLIGGRPDQSRAKRKPVGGRVMADGTIEHGAAASA